MFSEALEPSWKTPNYLQKKETVKNMLFHIKMILWWEDYSTLSSLQNASQYTYFQVLLL